jgi:hypothetical protein
MTMSRDGAARAEQNDEDQDEPKLNLPHNFSRCRCKLAEWYQSPTRPTFP